MSGRGRGRGRGEGTGREGEEGSEEGYERGRGISRLDLTAGTTPYPARHTNIMGGGGGGCEREGEGEGEGREERGWGEKGRRGVRKAMRGGEGSAGLT